MIELDNYSPYDGQRVREDIPNEDEGPNPIVEVMKNLAKIALGAGGGALYGYLFNAPIAASAGLFAGNITAFVITDIVVSYLAEKLELNLSTQVFLRAAILTAQTVAFLFAASALGVYGTAGLAVMGVGTGIIVAGMLGFSAYLAYKENQLQYNVYREI